MQKIKDATADVNAPFISHISGTENGAIVRATIVGNRKISFTESLFISIRHKNDNRSVCRCSGDGRRLGGLSLGRVHQKHATPGVNHVVGLFFNSSKKSSNCHNCQSGACNSAASLSARQRLPRSHSHTLGDPF